MKPTEASRTAMFMALFRALESQRTQERRLFYDQYAESYLSVGLRFIAGICRLAPVRGVIERIIDGKWPGAKTSGIARTRFIDDIVTKELERGTRQIVLLGAGFDSRPYRLSGIEKAFVLEVDHPATSEAKLRLTKKVLRTIPHNVRFVQIDFNQQDLERVLANAGYDSSQQTVLVWEGVSNYLSADAVDSTLQFCAKAATGSRVVFTYIDKRVLDDPKGFYGTEQIAKLLSGMGENWTFGIYPELLDSYLKERRLTLERDLSATQYRERYFKERSSQMRGYEFYRVAVAVVKKGNAL